jgi:hypothetical protein
MHISIFLFLCLAQTGYFTLNQLFYLSLSKKDCFYDEEETGSRSSIKMLIYILENKKSHKTCLRQTPKNIGFSCLNEKPLNKINVKHAYA